MTINIFDEYVQYHDAAIKSYGPKTCVFLHAGQFYEFYMFCPDEETIIGPNLWEIQEILQIIVTNRNKSKPHSRKNVYMMGVQTISKNKFANMLLSEGWTVVIVDQVT